MESRLNMSIRNIYTFISRQLLVILVITYLAYCQERLPTITEVSKDQVVSTGEKVVLQCTVKNLGRNTVSWFHQSSSGGLRLIASGQSRITEDTRFTVESRDEQYNLEIREVFASDAGNYMCQISTVQPVTRTIRVNVKVPPVIGEDSSRDTDATAGSSISLRCNATGHPTPTIYWQRNDEGELPRGGTRHIGPILEVPQVKKEDRGIYVCVADNRVGEGARRSVALRVQFAPSISVPQPRVAQAINYGLQAELRCEVEGYPPPHIVWTKDNEEITNNKDFVAADFPAGHETIISKLRVLGVHASDLGRYECTAQNEQGTSSAQVELIESDRPDFTHGGSNQLRPLNSATSLYSLSIISLLLLAFTASLSLRSAHH